MRTKRLLGMTAALLAGSALAWTGLFSIPLSTVQAGEPVSSPTPAPRDGFGTIKGKLVWGGAEAPKREVLVKKGDTSVKDGEVCATNDLLSNELVVDPASKGVRHGFAFLKGTGLANKNPDAEKALVNQDPEVLIDQKNCEFLPYATPVFIGQKVVFKSSDPIGHNLRYSGFKNLPKNVVLPPNGTMEEKLQAERLPMELKCDIHPWMKGWVLPLDHPFFAVTGADGSFEIQGVPAGKQTLVVWQELVGYANEGGSKGLEVTVKAGETVDVGAVKLDPGKVKKK